MRKIKFRTAVIGLVCFIFIASSVITLIHRYLWIKNNELERLKEFCLPMVTSYAEIIYQKLNNRLKFIEKVKLEIEKHGLLNPKNQVILDSIRFRNPDILFIGILNENGISVLVSPSKNPSGIKNVGKDYSDREYFKKVKITKSPIIGEVVIGKVIKEPLIPIILPLKHNGYLIVGVDIKIVREIIETFSPSYNAKMTLVDQFGKVISMPHGKKFEEAVEDLSDLSIFKEAKQNKSGFTRYISKYDGKEKYGIYNKLFNEWVLWIGIDKKEIDRRIYSSFYFALNWNMIILILSLSGAVILSLFISKPLTKFTALAKKISQGEFYVDDDPNLKNCAIEEISSLYASFHEMVNKLSDLYKNLERQVQERTQELNNALDTLKETNLKLEEKIKEVEQANMAKSEFLANMSHELRTPLNAIIGFTDLLLMNEALDGETKEQLGYVAKSAKHLLSLINDILDLSKIEAGKIEPFFEEFCIKEIIEETFIFFKEKALKHRIKTEISVDTKTEHIKADRRMIKQILFNLLSNAFKFTKEDGTIGVKVTDYIENEKPYILFEIYDTGIGIPEEKQRLLFQPFVQIENVFTKTSGGTGLGLALCKRFIELHNGRIWLESKVNVGSRFYFILPN